MLASVKLYNKFCFMAIEIHYEIVYCLLPLKTYRIFA